MAKNIILQHYNGDLGELEKLSVENIKKYAHDINADYELVIGKPFHKDLTNPCQKVYCIDEHWDNYEKVCMLDPDVFVKKGLSESVFNVPGNGVHGPVQKRLKTNFIKMGKITEFNPYWAGSIYKFSKKERQDLRAVKPESDKWMFEYSKPYYFEDEGILAELGKKAGLPISYMPFEWNQCSYLPNIQDAKIIHIRTKKFGQINGSWENGGKRPKIENQQDLMLKGII